MVKKAIIVDDTLDYRELITEILEMQGIQSVSFEDPTKALDYLKSEEVDLVITDYHMPQMTGAEFTRKARVDLGYANPIIMASNGYDLEATAKEAGVTYFIDKGDLFTGLPKLTEETVPVSPLDENLYKH